MPWSYFRAFFNKDMLLMSQMASIPIKFPSDFSALMQGIWFISSPQNSFDNPVYNHAKVAGPSRLFVYAGTLKAQRLIVSVQLAFPEKVGSQVSIWSGSREWERSLVYESLRGAQCDECMRHLFLSACFRPGPSVLPCGIAHGSTIRAWGRTKVACWHYERR